jgi:hypothetical protein
VNARRPTMTAEAPPAALTTSTPAPAFGERGFRATTSRRERAATAARLRTLHPGHVPVVCEIGARDLVMSKAKFVTSETMTVGEFTHVIRPRLSLNGKALGAYSALLLFTEDGRIPPATNTLGDVYRAHANEDGLMYLRVSVENTFG